MRAPSGCQAVHPHALLLDVRATSLISLFDLVAILV
jgi:hypothetical protein